MAKTKAPAMNPDDMSEAELAEHFYTHRHDLAGEEVSSQTPARMDVMISARFSQAEAEQVRTAAASGQMSVSAFLRQGVLAALGPAVVDLRRVRADLVEVRARADDALAALGGEPGPTPDSPPRPATPGPKRKPDPR